MLKLSFKIWSLANLVVFLVFAISLFPNGFKEGFTALFYSSLFSFPATIILYLFLVLLETIRTRIFFNWIILLTATGLTAYAAFLLFQFWFAEDAEELNFILPLSMVSAYAAVLFVSPSLNYLFQKFQYENETECY